MAEQQKANDQALKEIREYLSDKELTDDQRDQLREGCSKAQLEVLGDVIDG